MSIQPGNTVVVHYVGTLVDGTEFDRSPADSPLIFQVGQGQLIPGFEQAVTGRDKGDSFTVTIPADQAYGPHDPNLMFQVPREQAPDNLTPELGLTLHVTTDQGELEVAISAMDEANLTLDANHPLAGQDLTFALRIEDIR